MSRKAGRRRAASTRPAVAAVAPAPPSSAWTAGALIFAFALALRLLYWQATPDATWPYSAAFKGDALVWLDAAVALQHGQPFELGLPLRPPGNAYLLALAWNGQSSGIVALRLLWCLFGAAAAPLTYLAAQRSFGPRVAFVAGGLSAASSGLMLLSASLDSESPYLLVALASLALFESLRRRPQALTLAAFGALQGLGCLFRVEHALFSALFMAVLVRLWRGPDERAPLRTAAGRAGCVAATALLALAPWHVHAWRAVERFNSEPPPATPAERAVERGLSGLRWDAAAQRGRDELPAFARRTAALFVAATVAHRGGTEVRAADLAVLDEAFGARPRPLARFPFVALYGPLNFALANHAGAAGGFSPERLEEPPPLSAHPERYPAPLVAGLPPPQLAFSYPPHLRLINDGYALGTRYIAGHPLDFLRLAALKLRRFWAGAASGLGGFNLPLGPSGVRRAVDLVTPEDGLAAGLWSLFVLASALVGVAAGARHRALAPWLCFLSSKAVAVALFFGYARQGALVIPVVALLLALALESRLLSLAVVARHGRRVAGLLILSLVALEGARCLLRPSPWLDGRPCDSTDPFPADWHRDQRYELRFGR